MQKFILTVSSFIVLTLLVSCKKDNNDTPGTECINTSEWVKNGRQFVFVNEPIYLYADSLYISLEEVSPGIFKSTTKYDDGTIYPTMSNYIQSCGNSIYQSASASMENKQEAYRMDGNIGDTWSTVTTSSGGNTITNTTTITAKNVSISVPAGTYTCLQLHSVAVSSNPLYSTVETDFYLNNVYGPVKVIGESVHYELARKNY